MTMNEDVIIHLEWEGPFSFEKAKQSSSDSDWGVYQIYGCHPVYGSEVLLYIGKAEKQYFGNRLTQETWWEYLSDHKRTEIYFGRLAGVKAPDDSTWNRHIDLAERLLIYAHRPAWNAQKNINRIEPDLQNVHVLNWGCHRDLLPEVSGKRWTSRFDEKGWHTFKGAETRINSVGA